MHALWLDAFVYVPFGQAAHTRSFVGLPSTLTYEPGPHDAHPVQELALLVVLNVPGAHGVHVRSVVLEPFEPTRVPAAHAVHAAHGVAAFAS
jgi:hypothetical protein